MHSEKQCGTSIPGRSNWCKNITCSSMYPDPTDTWPCTNKRSTSTNTYYGSHIHPPFHTHTHTNTHAHTHTTHTHTHTNFTSKAYRFCTVKAQVSASLVASRDMHYMRSQLINVMPRGTHTTAARRLAPIRE